MTQIGIHNALVFSKDKDGIKIATTLRDSNLY
jgi:hypothetical protein